MSADYARENAAERERLFRLTSDLSEKDLESRMANGWSVATKLLHLAFWDQYALALLKSWKSTSVTASSLEVDAVNEGVRVLSYAVPPKAVVRLVRAAAEGVDAEVERIQPELKAAIEASGRTRLLLRAAHRREHLDQIEKALNAGRGPSA
jgi:hypothetical protein